MIRTTVSVICFLSSCCTIVRNNKDIIYYKALYLLVVVREATHSYTTCCATRQVLAWGCFEGGTNLRQTVRLWIVQNCINYRGYLSLKDTKGWPWREEVTVALNFKSVSVFAWRD